MAKKEVSQTSKLSKTGQFVKFHSAFPNPESHASKEHIVARSARSGRIIAKTSIKRREAMKALANR